VGLALVDKMKKRDWAFVAVCVAGALLFGGWSVRMGIAYQRSQQGVTDISSSHRRGGDASAVKTDDVATQPARPQ